LEHICGAYLTSAGMFISSSSGAKIEPEIHHPEAIHSNSPARLSSPSSSANRQMLYPEPSATKPETLRPNSAPAGLSSHSRKVTGTQQTCGWYSALRASRFLTISTMLRLPMATFFTLLPPFGVSIEDLGKGRAQTFDGTNFFHLWPIDGMITHVLLWTALYPSPPLVTRL
jgi:hypothetical protein